MINNKVFFDAEVINAAGKAIDFNKIVQPKEFVRPGLVHMEFPDSSEIENNKGCEIKWINEKYVRSKQEIDDIKSKWLARKEKRQLRELLNASISNEKTRRL